MKPEELRRWTEEFFDSTSHRRGERFSSPRTEGFHKPHPALCPEGKRVSLPKPEKIPLFFNRRSERNPSPKNLPLSSLSSLLANALGSRESGEMGLYFRTYPSAGALHPLEVRVCAVRVSGLAPGIYHYSPVRHELTLLREGDFSRSLFSACLEQSFVLTSPVTLLLSCVPERSEWKYDRRGLRYALMDAGFAGENVYLAAESLGLKTVCVGAFFDEEVSSLFLLSEEEWPLMLFPVFL